MKKITKTFYVSSDDFESLQNPNLLGGDFELFGNSRTHNNKVEITFSVPEKIAQVSESEFKNLWFGSRYEQAAKKLFGESHD